ncbi:MAG: 30S ribosomal protein S15 [Candidatus Hodarchaeales archaeon]
MARMHSRRKGKSGSKKPVWTSKPSWITYGAEEIENLVVQKAKEGHPSSFIGVILRDSYGIPDVKRLTGKTVSKIMKESNIYPKYPEDMLNLVSKAWNLRKHISANPKDLHSRRGLTLIESKIRRLVKYYRKTKVLPQDFKYEPEKAPLYLSTRA